MRRMLSAPLAEFFKRQLLWGVQFVPLGYVVKHPALRTLQPDHDSRSLLCSHRQPPLYLKHKTKYSKNLTTNPNVSPKAIKFFY